MQHYLNSENMTSNNVPSRYLATCVQYDVFIKYFVTGLRSDQSRPFPRGFSGLGRAGYFISWVEGQVGGYRDE